MNKLKFTIVSVCVGSLGSTAFGAEMQLDLDLRRLSSNLTSYDNDGLQKLIFSNGFLSLPDEPFALWEEGNNGGVPGWDIQGYQSSTVSESAFSAFGTLFGSVIPSSATLFDADGTNNYLIQFTLIEETEFALNAVLTSIGGYTESGVTIVDLGSSSTVFSKTVFDGQETIEESILLGAGSYQFTMGSSMNLGYDLGTYSAGYSGTFAIVPAPSGLVGLAFGGLIGVRRRR